MPPTPSKSLLTKKAGPLPVWGWALASLGLAYAYSRYKTNKAAQSSAASTPTTGAAGEPGTGAPYYVIENNLPPASAPIVNVNPPPVTTPPNSGPTPPITHRGHPPVWGHPIKQPAPGPAPTPTPVSSKPTYQSHTVVSGDSYSKIASEYHVPNQGSTPAWEVLYNYNIGPSSPHSAAARAELQKQGPNLIYSGQTVYIPA